MANRLMTMGRHTRLLTLPHAFGITSAVAAADGVACGCWGCFAAAAGGMAGCCGLSVGGREANRSSEAEGGAAAWGAATRLGMSLKAGKAAATRIDN